MSPAAKSQEPSLESHLSPSPPVTVPGGHFEHAVPLGLRNVPFEHPVQSDMDLPPQDVKNELEGQDTQVVWDGALEYLPGEHNRHADIPELPPYNPGWHDSHNDFPIAF